MKKYIYTLSLVALLGGCATKPIEKVDTELEEKQNVNSNENLGKNSDGTYVYQKKEKMADYLISLQKEVFGLEQEVYGNRSYGNVGKYGSLENCKVELKAKTAAEWGLAEMPKKFLASQEEEKIMKKKFGIDEKGELVVLSEDELTSRIQRFEKYKTTYNGQVEWFDTEIKNCKLKLKN